MYSITGTMMQRDAQGYHPIRAIPFAQFPRFPRARAYTIHNTPGIMLLKTPKRPHLGASGGVPQTIWRPPEGSPDPLSAP